MDVNGGGLEEKVVFKLVLKLRGRVSAIGGEEVIRVKVEGEGDGW